MDVKEKNNTEKTNAAAEPVAEDLNEVMRIRREKLAALVAEGKNPFEITKFPKTHDSSDVKNDFERQCQAFFGNCAVYICILILTIYFRKCL